MAFTNIEIKARTNHAAAIRQYLLDNKAEFKGTDLQMDTYFNVPSGRLKLRQGNIENSLIFYERKDDMGPKQSDFSLSQVSDGETLKEVLTRSLGIKVVVEKKREIYFIGNVKFHIDILRQLGNFVEIEASDKYMPLSLEQLHEQCNFYIEKFAIKTEDMVNVSYSDMLLV